jgi:subtilisin family serine protease
MVQRIKPGGAPKPAAKASEARPAPAKPAAAAPKDAKPAGWTPKAKANALERALADRQVTDAEWRTVAPELRGTALGAPENRRLLEAYVNKGVGFDAGASEGARQLLADKGFDVPGRAPDAKGTLQPREVNLKHVLEGTVAEPDETFHALSALVGGAKSLRVAIVDGGFAAHPILADNLAGDRAAAKAAAGAPIGRRLGDFTALEQQHGARHGTHVAGIATKGTERIQASLFAVPLEVPDDPEAANKPARASRLPAALEAAAKTGASVVNVSIESFVSPEEAARYRAVMEQHPDTLFVFGAGNDGYELGTATEGDKTVVESFRLPNMVVVGASLPDGGRWSQSNTSAQWVDVAARGHAIASASSTGAGLIPESGTSMAAPNVSNLAAKCRLLNPGLEPAKLVKLLQATSDAHWSWKGQVASGGTVNADRAMTGAAALALVAKGTPLPQALELLRVPADERAKLSEALAGL